MQIEVTYTARVINATYIIKSYVNINNNNNNNKNNSNSSSKKNHYK